MNEKPACFNIWPPRLLQLQFMAWREDAFCHCLCVQGGSSTNRLQSKLFQNFLGHHVIHLLPLSKIVLSLLSFRKMGASLLADLKNSAKVFKEQVLLDLFHQHFQWPYMLSTAKYFFNSTSLPFSLSAIKFQKEVQDINISAGTTRTEYYWIFLLNVAFSLKSLSSSWKIMILYYLFWYNSIAASA